MATKILLIGKPDSGKTIFIGQFYTRIDSNKGVLEFRQGHQVENLNPIIESLRALADAKEPDSTPTDKSIIIPLPLQHGETKIDLDCPDYGGEQVNRIVEDREVDTKWTDSIKQSDKWILFIKPNDLTTSYDLSNKTIKPEEIENGNSDSHEYSISDQSFFIELLQILLNTKGQDSHFKNSITKLTVVLTCWDELKNTTTPKEELKKNLPLLLNFIETNWIESKVNFLGLSSLGFSLKEQENRLKYKEFGPENYGYMIKSDGKNDDDITQLILEAIS